MTKSRPFIQIFVILWKISVFIGTVLILTQVLLPKVGVSSANLDSFSFAMKQGLLQFWSSAMSVDWSSPVYIFVIQSVASLLFYWFGTIACKIGAQVLMTKVANLSFILKHEQLLQRYCLAFPVVIMTPVLILSLMMAQFNTVNPLPSHFASNKDDDHHQITILLSLSFIWFLSKIWITLFIWEPVTVDSAITDPKWYNPLLIDQSSILSSPSYRDQAAVTSSCSTNCTVTTRMFAVATMWHETSDEMLTILKSIFRMDKDQSERRNTRNCYKVVKCR